MERIMDNEITYPVAQGTQTFFEKAATAGLELRTGQVEMAMEICEAIMKTTPLAVEAEVGIGKSYAYLIPAVMKYRKPCFFNIGFNKHKRTRRILFVP